MNRVFRIITVVVALFAVAFLARNKVAWASGLASEASQDSSTQFEGFVWDDVNKDGIQDLDETGLPDVTVNLYNSSNELVNSTVTDENGMYLFNNLAPGEYYIEIVKPAGFVISPQHRGGDDARDSDPHSKTGKTTVKKIDEGENHRIWDAGLYPLNAFRHKPEPGTVKPPPRVIIVCRDGDFSVGGVAGLKVTDLKRGYCLQAFLWNHRFAFGRIPDNSGKFLANITFLRIFHYSRLVQNLPAADGMITICYAVPPDKQAQIYFYDFNHRRFGKKTEAPSWEPLQTTVEDGVACAPAQSTGAYALIGK